MSDESSPQVEAAQGKTPQLKTINIRNLSVRCGRCGRYQVLAAFQPKDEEWNLYTYECDWPPCDDDVPASRTLIEVPAELDEFALRNPSWHGGARHAGALHGGGHGEHGHDGHAHDEHAHDEHAHGEDGEQEGAGET